MVKLQYNKNQYTVTIPTEYVNQAKLVKGDILTISFNERGNIELMKVKEWRIISGKKGKEVLKNDRFFWW